MNGTGTETEKNGRQRRKERKKEKMKGKSNLCSLWRRRGRSQCQCPQSGDVTLRIQAPLDPIRICNRLPQNNNFLSHENTMAAGQFNPQCLDCRLDDGVDQCSVYGRHKNFFLFQKFQTGSGGSIQFRTLITTIRIRLEVREVQLSPPYRLPRTRMSGCLPPLPYTFFEV